MHPRLGVGEILDVYDRQPKKHLEDKRDGDSERHSIETATSYAFLVPSWRLWQREGKLPNWPNAFAPLEEIPSNQSCRISKSN